MQRYMLYRFGQSILTLVGVSILVFALTRASGNVLDFILPLEATPEDYARVSEEWGLDKPIYGQYGIYMWKLAQGDFGESWKWGGGALDVVLGEIPRPPSTGGLHLVDQLCDGRINRSVGSHETGYLRGLRGQGGRLAGSIPAHLLDRHCIDVGVCRDVGMGADFGERQHQGT